MTFCGTLDYASPEILERKGGDLSVDVWSIGVLTYELLMNKAPFEDKDKDSTKLKIIQVAMGIGRSTLPNSSTPKASPNRRRFSSPT
jgi:aurora kinase